MIGLDFIQSGNCSKKASLLVTISVARTVGEELVYTHMEHGMSHNRKEHLGRSKRCM